MLFRSLWVVALATMIGVILLGVFNSVTGIVLFALTGFATAASSPLIERIILRQTPGSVRATILSVDSLFQRVLLALIGPMIGMIADRSSLPSAFLGVGVGFGVLLLVVLILWRRAAPLSST